MYFCDAAIGLSGVICGVMPRLVLWRTVMNVVVTLIATAQRITILACSGTYMVPVNSTLSEMWAPKMLAFCALFTTDSDRPYGVGPDFQSAIPRSTLNRAKNTGSCATRGRHPPSGLTPFSR